MPEAVTDKTAHLHAPKEQGLAGDVGIFWVLPIIVNLQPSGPHPYCLLPKCPRDLPGGVSRGRGRAESSDCLPKQVDLLQGHSELTSSGLPTTKGRPRLPLQSSPPGKGFLFYVCQEGRILLLFSEMQSRLSLTYIDQSDLESEKGF